MKEAEKDWSLKTSLQGGSSPNSSTVISLFFLTMGVLLEVSYDDLVSAKACNIPIRLGLLLIVNPLILKLIL